MLKPLSPLERIDMTATTQRPVRQPLLKWLGITAATLAGLLLLMFSVVLAMFSGNWM